MCRACFPALDDISVMNVSTIIPPGVYEACIKVLAIDDRIIEGDEIFTVSVEVEDQRDRIDGNATVIISDNDGKLQHNNVL